MIEVTNFLERSLDHRGIIRVVDIADTKAVSLNFDITNQQDL